MAASLTACAGSQDAPVEEVARDFYQAFADADGEQACALLSERTRTEVEKNAETACDEALLEEDLPAVREPGSVEVFGVMALVRFDDGPGEPQETTFFSRYDDGWRVTAAGCRPTGEGTPYDCQVSGG